jgi:hypothetical protein
MKPTLFALAAIAVTFFASPSSATPVIVVGGGPVGYVCSLTITIGTGDDDLRGGDDNLQAWILLPFGATGAPTWLSLSDLINAGAGGINARRNWPNWSSWPVRVPLPDCSIRSDRIRGIRLMTHATGGVSGDNWDLQSIAISWDGYANPPTTGLNLHAHGDIYSITEPRHQTFLFRFTGTHPFTQYNW